MALTATKDQMDGLKSAIRRMIDEKMQEVGGNEFRCFMEEGLKKKRIEFQNKHPGAFVPALYPPYDHHANFSFRKLTYSEIATLIETIPEIHDASEVLKLRPRRNSTAASAAESENPIMSLKHS
jgi:hypothetical protein